MKKLFSLGSALLALSQVQAQTGPEDAQVYPNPFCQSATIEFELIAVDTISLNIIDVTGQVVQTFFDSTPLPPGSYLIDITSDTLPAGVYVAKLEYGFGQQINLQVVKQCNVTGAADGLSRNDILAYPNPASNNIFISLDGEKQIVVTNANGRICKSLTTTSNAFSTHDISSGNYLLSVYDRNKKLLATTCIAVIK